MKTTSMTEKVKVGDDIRRYSLEKVLLKNNLCLMAFENGVFNQYKKRIFGFNMYHLPPYNRP